MSSLEASMPGKVIKAIEEQGYIDISKRWRLGERNDKSGELVFLDRTSTLEKGQSQYYRLKPGVAKDL